VHGSTRRSTGVRQDEVHDDGRRGREQARAEAEADEHRHGDRERSLHRGAGRQRPRAAGERGRDDGHEPADRRRDHGERQAGEQLRSQHARAVGHERERDQRGPLRPLRGDEQDARHGHHEAGRRQGHREREVALAVGAGRPNAEIAAELHMSVATVKAQVSRLLEKLEGDDRVQIALLVQPA
jgi:ATP/maltotriose-dependent transcriptional regulator MalT